MANRFIDFSNLRGDALGGLTAGVVALPLALAFGEASGVGPIAGLWGAIFVGFFAALFGGTGSQISGPTGPMIVVFAGAVATIEASVAAKMPDATTADVLAEAIPLIFAAVVLAGLIQIAMGVSRLGQYIRLVPYPVVSGFMSGIGVIIIALQVSRLFGHEPDGTGTIPALAAIPGAVSDPVLPALIVGGASLATVFVWPKAIGKFLPAPLAALIIGTVLSLFVGMPKELTLGDIPRGFPAFTIPGFSSETIGVVLEAAILLALLGAIDSLLTSLVADNLTRDRHDSDRELIGQGVGNAVAGFFGAIPGAGATMRTFVNIRTGGLTKISGMTHSLFLLSVVLVLAPLAERIPHAVLAGILIKVGYDIIDIAYLRRAHKGPRWDLALMGLVLGLTVFVDLIVAVGVGVFLAALAFVKQIADIQIERLRAAEQGADVSLEERALLDEAKGDVTLFQFGGPLSFGAAADLGHHVRERVKNGTKAIILDFHGMPSIDVSAARAVETIAADAKTSHKSLFVSGMTDKVRDTLRGLGVEACLAKDTAFKGRLEAIKAAIAEIERNRGGDGAPAGAAAAPAQ